MTKRIYISPDRVTVSKPGIDAENPPVVDYKYLALDSRLDQGRPLEVGLVPNYVFGNPVFFSTTYSFAPAVDIIPFTISGAGITYLNRLVIRDDNGTTAFERPCYIIKPFSNRFQPVDAAVNYRSNIFGTTVTMYYIAWDIRS